MYDQKVEFLKYGIAHVEKRIELLDQKASILMAIMGGFYVVIVSLLKDFMGILDGGQTSLWLSMITYIFLILGFVFTCIVVYLLLMTIRPRKGLFRKDMKVESYRLSRPIFWFSNGVTNSDYYYSTMDNLNDEDIYENLKVTHHSSLQLVERKYYYYRKSISFINLLIIYNSVGVIVLLLISLFQLF